MKKIISPTKILSSNSGRITYNSTLNFRISRKKGSNRASSKRSITLNSKPKILFTPSWKWRKKNWKKNRNHLRNKGQDNRKEPIKNTTKMQRKKEKYNLKKSNKQLNLSDSKCLPKKFPSKNFKICSAKMTIENTLTPNGQKSTFQWRKLWTSLLMNQSIWDKNQLFYFRDTSLKM